MSESDSDPYDDSVLRIYVFVFIFEIKIKTYILNGVMKMESVFWGHSAVFDTDKVVLLMI